MSTDCEFFLFHLTQNLALKNCLHGTCRHNWRIDLSFSKGQAVKYFCEAGERLKHSDIFITDEMDNALCRKILLIITKQTEKGFWNSLLVNIYIFFYSLKPIFFSVTLKLSASCCIKVTSRGHCCFSNATCLLYNTHF